jgi:methylenetetrahydrofolate reductase (NADPH)
MTTPDGAAPTARASWNQPSSGPVTVTERIGRGRFVSFELWPPRSAESAAALEVAIEGLASLRPAFVAITYGAGGSTRERTHDLVARLAGTELPPLAHLTCAAHGRAELVALLRRYLDAGVRDLLALHGDPPLSAEEALPEGDLRFAIELVALARQVGFPSVGVAVHPEGHPAAASRAEDLRRQAEKLGAADFGLTQFLHRASDYAAFVDAMAARGVDTPVVPGVMPVTNVRQLERMAAMSGTEVPLSLASALHAVADRPEEVRRIGVEHATELCRELLDAGAPGLHFYTMNRAAATLEVCANLGFEPAGATRA